MPAALDIDWEEVKALYLQGMRPKALAERYGCPVTAVHKRISRGNWTELARKTAEAVSGTDPQALQTMVDTWVSKINRSCVTHLEDLDRKPKKSLKDLKEAAETLKLLGDTQYKNLGREAGQQPVSVGLVGITLHVEAYQPKPEPKAIDVDSTHVQDSESKGA